MKILVITHYYLPEVGAPQRRWSALIRRWQAAGHQVTVCCPGPHYPAVEATSNLRDGRRTVMKVETGQFGEQVIRVPYLLHGYSGWIRLVDQAIVAAGSVGASLFLKGRGHQFDAMVATVPGVPTLFAGVALKKLLGVPLVVEMRDAWPDVITSVKRKNRVLEVVSKKIFAPSVKAMQQKADLLVSATESFATVLRERGLTPVETISNGTTARSDLAAVAPLAGREGEPLKVLYMGTIGRSQGLYEVVKAVLKARQMAPDAQIQLRIVGEGADKPKLQEYVQAHDLPVEFLPLQPREKVAEHYEWADATLVSLKENPAFEWTVPSKLFELLSVPRLVIGLVAGEAAHILDQSGAGIRVNPGDSRELARVLVELAQDRSRLAVGQRGREFALKNFNFDELAERYLELLAGLARR